jgi:hypothetical protein
MSDASSELEITARTQIRRMPNRGHYDLATIRAILDEAFLCHVSVDLGSGPVIIPMAFGRVDDDIYLHGAAGNALLRAIARGSDLCCGHVDRRARAGAIGVSPFDELPLGCRLRYWCAG